VILIGGGQLVAGPRYQWGLAPAFLVFMGGGPAPAGYVAVLRAGGQVMPLSSAMMSFIQARWVSECVGWQPVRW